MSMEEELQKGAEILTALEEERHVAHLHKRAEELTEEAADIQQKLLLATTSSARLEFYRPIDNQVAGMTGLGELAASLRP